MSYVKLSNRSAARIWSKNLQLISGFAVRRGAFAQRLAFSLQSGAAGLTESIAKLLIMWGLGS
jgi:hypothetical protein